MRHWVLCAAGLLASGCQEADSPEQLAAQAELEAARAASEAARTSALAAHQGVPLAQAHVEGAVLGYIRWQGGLITLQASPRGPRFSVTSRDQILLASGLSQEELTQRFPETEHLVRSALASGGLDARLDHRVVDEAQEHRQRHF